jgi:hypothetical protein
VSQPFRAARVQALGLPPTKGPIFVPRRTSLAVLAALAAALVALLALPAIGSAQSRTNVIVGVGDQRASVFADPTYRALGLKRTRYFISWDAIRNPVALAQADAYVAAARAAGVKVLMHISTNDLRPRRARLPTVAQYRRDVGALVRRYKPQGVREWGTWNEANHVTQPTYRSARRAAQFYVAMRSFCSGCTIVGLDVLDQRSTRSPSIDFRNYIRAWFRAAGRSGRLMTVVGLHNYSEVNRRLTRNTRDLIASVRQFNRRAKFWYTETGGLAEFASAFPCNVNRQANRTQYMFDLARRFRADVKRLFIYNYYGTDCSTRFDAGLVNANGTARPAYNVVAQNLPRFKR